MADTCIHPCTGLSLPTPINEEKQLVYQIQVRQTIKTLTSLLKMQARQKYLSVGEKYGLFLLIPLEL